MFCDYMSKAEFAVIKDGLKISSPHMCLKPLHIAMGKDMVNHARAHLLHNALTPPAAILNSD